MIRTLVLATSLLLLFVTPADAFIRGDADGNGTVNPLVDGLFIFNYGFIPGSTEPPCLDAADFDDDGMVSALVDGIGLLNWGFVPGSPPPAPPFPDDGSDPTPDSIPDGDCGGGTVGPLPFLTIQQGSFSGAPEQTSIFRDDAAWAAFWAQHSTDPLPPVDFSEEMVVVVLQEYGTGGDFFEIDQLFFNGVDVEVEYTLGAPIGGCPVILLFTEPHHIVRAQLAPGNPIPVETIVDSCP